MQVIGQQATQVIEESIAVSATPERVWRVISDLERWPQWHKDCAEAAYAEGKPWALGAKFRYAVKQGRATRRTKAIVVASSPPDEVAWQYREHGGRTELTVRIAADGSGARVMCRQLSTAQSGPSLLGVLFRRKADGPRERLKSWLAALKAEAERTV